MPNNVMDVSAWLDALAGSHDRLSDIVGALDDEGLRSPSYCDGWTVAQVLSHVGSGAEIMGGAVDAGVAGEAPPSRDTYPQIWERWNAMGPREAAEAALGTDGELVERLEHLGDGLSELEFTLFGGMRMDAVGLLRTRLGEHALHTWDVAVTLDPRALVEADAVTLLSDGLARMTGWLGKAELADQPRPFTVRVVVSDPDHQFDLSVGDAVSASMADDADAGQVPPRTLHLPAEAFLRLVYGRLDPSHTPDVPPEEQSTLDTLRKVFPGF
ncbi:MAG: maleylpyruvate isomerase N-terminal domain-containing protein [Acidimicrobiales bacterium]